MDLSTSAGVSVKIEPEKVIQMPCTEIENEILVNKLQSFENSGSMAQNDGMHFSSEINRNNGHKFDFSEKYEHSDPVRSSSGTFPCPHCKYSSKYMSNIKRHLLTHSGEKPFPCLCCNHSCSSKSNLLSHMLTHSGEKPFACSDCSYTSSDKSTMNRHMLTHSGEKPFSCSDCSYVGSRKSHLKRHMLTHSGEKPFSCQECNYACSDRSLLRRHMLTCHFPVPNANVHNRENLN